jgi:hypothetical protein
VLARRASLQNAAIHFVVSVAELQKLAGHLAKEYRFLDTRLQELNWKTELE